MAIPYRTQRYEDLGYEDYPYCKTHERLYPGKVGFYEPERVPSYEDNTELENIEDVLHISLLSEAAKKRNRALVEGRVIHPVKKVKQEAPELIVEAKKPTLLEILSEIQML